MTSGGVLRRILLFALPIMAANLLQQLYNTADNIIVGNFAEKSAPGSFAAVGSAAPLTFLYLAFAMGLGTAVSVVCSQLFGAREEDRLSRAVDTSLIFIGAAGVAVMIIGWAAAPALLRGVLRVKNSTDAAGVEYLTYDYAVRYLRIYCIGLPFQFVYNAAASALRGVGDSRASLLFLLVTSVVNVALDLWFIVAFNAGVAGAAWATVISQVICAALAYWYLRRRFPLVRGDRHFDPALCKTTLRIGLPTAVQQSVVSLGNIAMMALVQHFAAVHTAGIAIISAYTAGSRVDMFFYVPVIGLQSALAAFTGQNIAANRIDRVRRALYLTEATGVAVSVALCVTLYCLAEPVVRLFGVDGSAIAIGAEQVRYYSTVFWIFSVYMILGGVLQGAGDTLLQSAATLSALAMRVAIAYLGVYAFSRFGYEAAWSTLAFGWATALIITGARYVQGGWKKKVIARRES
jgi:putative MATE family efflux protein